ncbi:3-hydroxy-9,10-secoandrosta-1,3,5(10)-triene-9, 17-dione monooxygenase [Pseudomonas sp. OF001]|uniref:acyl-CoA dehydrogenase family protein n=1 Tax=Pseudomonas sp. OF001 TaxID=2772300 RepID=UPI0019CBBD1F|nr:acyl-CoA dehydrogenase family protein [Pseudomonas sp. OF001]CAD5377696.1 3-hydroxy-9,10-secoandrosta-1,3,5(10)-triene-9, 17-dione monooxygenase [Pseudomonas sp. OF001]
MGESMEQTTRISPEQMVARARALVPLLAERAAQAEAELKVADEVIAALQEAQLFRVMQPKRHGGFEFGPKVFAEIQQTLAEGCMSTAWMYGVVAVHPWQLALFPEQAQQEVWGEDASTLVASTYMPVARVTEVEGGYRISGRWGFSTGCEHCEWVFLGGNLTPGVGKGNSYRTFLVPKSDFRIERNWDVIGLRGTGSHDIVVEDAFVPLHRTHATQQHDDAANPGRELNSAPLYRVPFAQMFIPAVSNACIGGLAAAIQHFKDYAQQGISKNVGMRTVDDPNAQLAYARAVVAHEQMVENRKRHYEVQMAWAERGEAAPVNERLRQRYQLAQVANECAHHINELLRCCGATGTYRSNPLTRIFLDVFTGRAHIANNVDLFGRAFGFIALTDQTTTDSFL